MMAESGNCVIVVRQDILVQFQAIQYETSLDVNMQMEQFFQLYHCVKSVHVKLDSADLDPDSTIVLSDVFKKFAADYNSPISVSPVIPKLEETIATLTTATQVTTPNRTKVTSASKMVSSDAVIPQTLPLEHITSQALSAQTDPTATFPTDAVSMPTFSMQSAMSPSKHTEHGMEDSFFDATGSEPSDTECDMTPMILQTSDIPADEIGQNDVADEVLLPSGCISVGNNTEEKRARRRMRNTGTGKKRGPYRSRLDRGMPIERDAILDDSGIFIRLARSFYCTICNKDIYRASHARRHAFVHTKEKPFSCDQCGKCYQRQDHLNIHLKIHAGLIVPKKRKRKKNPGFTCTICHKWFRRPCYEEIHMRTHTGEKPFSCDECGRCFAREEGRILHMKIHTVPKPSRKKRPEGFTCEVCHKWFHNFSHQARHMRIHTGERPWKCDRCQKQFNRKESYTKHIAELTCEKRILRSQTKTKVGFTCEICNKYIRDASRKARHMRLHADVASFQCETCHRPFFHKESYRNHVHGKLCETKVKKGSAFKCGICNKVYQDASHRARHMRLHARNAPFECEKCFKTFQDEEAYQTHVDKLCEYKVKNEKRRDDGFTCEICDKHFRDSSNEARHMRLHSGKKPYECEKCNETFYRKDVYQKHVKAKLCENKIKKGLRTRRKFTCHICHKTFLKMESRAQHMKTHVRQKRGPKKSTVKKVRHNCLECDIDFSLERQLTKHIATTHCQIEIEEHAERGNESDEKVPIKEDHTESEAEVVSSTIDEKSVLDDDDNSLKKDKGVSKDGEISTGEVIKMDETE